MKVKLVLVTLLLLCSFKLISQGISKRITEEKWNAFWITVPKIQPHGYGVYHFRKVINLGSKPGAFIIHISADPRYKLFVNGELVSLGPARSDIYHWNFETVDIAKQLRQGDNIIAAEVWNFGEYNPEAQMTYETAFIVQGNTAAEEIINTNSSWKAVTDTRYSALQPQLIYTFYVAGPGEKVDASTGQSNWKSLDFNDSMWLKARTLFTGLPKGVFEWTDGWMLVPRKIPMMELKPVRFAKVRLVDGIKLPEAFPLRQTAINIPANRKVKILLDQSELVNAYPLIKFSAGHNASITISYAEALYVDEKNGKDWRAQNQKGNRDQVEGKRFVGVKDQVISNGQQDQEFTTLAWRTWRYVQLEIETAEQTLVIDDISGVFTGYPFELKAKLNTNNNELVKILETGWRTARLCAVETYMDCPYYEQLQYIGDTRIQALISLYNSGDDRMVRNAIEQLDRSRLAEGITLSRFPTTHAQEIPPFSLWWIGMLHDYYWYRGDSSFVKDHIPGMRQVLWFFNNYQQKDGSLYKLPYWNFTDWCESTGWFRGVAPVGKNGNSAALDLQLLWAYQLAAELEKSLGMKEMAANYSMAAEQLRNTIRNKYWDASKQVFADTEEKNLYSQHTNTLAILTGLIDKKSSALIAEKIMNDSTLAPATIYFKYYVHQALNMAGYGNEYTNWLNTWRENLQNGMTTWGEISDINKTRSDCHAWGASPNIELFRILLGIDSDAPGFQKVKIEPQPGKITKIGGSMPHPNGEIKADYVVSANTIEARIELPPNLSGKFVWRGKAYALKAGVNQVTAK